MGVSGRGPLPAPSALPLTLYIASCSCGVFRPLEPHRQRGHLRGQPQGSAGVPQAQEGVPALGGVKPVWSGSAEPGAREAAAPWGPGSLTASSVWSLTCPFARREAEAQSRKPRPKGESWGSVRPLTPRVRTAVICPARASSPVAHRREQGRGGCRRSRGGLEPQRLDLAFVVES